MTQCWPEGALRAYLDGELPAVDVELVAAHLGECPVCAGLCTELAARAAHVSALLDLLPEPVPEWSGAMARSVRPTAGARATHSRARSIGIAAALAAGLAVAAYLLPNRHPTDAVAHSARAPKPMLVSPPAPAPALAQVAAAGAGTAIGPALTPVPPPRRPHRARRPPSTAPEPAYFLALDDEPFDSGIIMRVAVKPGNLQADVVFGPDGRARAFRVINASQRNYK
jgi:hypothetical protein